MWTYIIAAAVFFAVGFALYSMFRDKKKGRGCGNCPGCGNCGSESECSSTDISEINNNETK